MKFAILLLLVACGPAPELARVVTEETVRAAGVDGRDVDATPTPTPPPTVPITDIQDALDAMYARGYQQALTDNNCAPKGQQHHGQHK